MARTVRTRSDLDRTDRKLNKAYRRDFAERRATDALNRRANARELVLA